MKKKTFFFFTLSFNLVKVQDCCLLKFKDILGYISAYHPTPALTGFYFIGRIQFLTSVAFLKIFNWECAIRLLSLRKFYFCLPCILTHSTSVVIRHFILFYLFILFLFLFYLFIYLIFFFFFFFFFKFFFLFFFLVGGNFGVFFSKFRSSSYKSKVFPEN